MFKQINFITILLVFLTACIDTSGVNSVSTSLHSLGSDEDPADSSWFYIDIDSDRYSEGLVPFYEISTTEEYGDSVSRRGSRSNCEIEHISSVDRDADDFDRRLEEKTPSPSMVCILDIPEFEFVTKDLHITYNFPEFMCESVKISLPWHFNYNIAPGPYVEECQREVGENEDGTPQLEAGFCARGSCASQCITNEEDLCLSQTIAGKPCCHGGRRLQEGDEESGQWIPNLDCFGGPARIAGGSFREEATSGNPLSFLINEVVRPLTREGLKGTVSLNNLLSFNRTDRTTIPFANYLKELDRPFESLPTNRGGFPVFLQPDEHFLHSNNAPYLPRLFFKFSCLDSGGEAIHEILLMIREWNTFEEFFAFFESNGEEDRDPNVRGSEGRQCEYDVRWDGAADAGIRNSDACNDEWDLEDYAEQHGLYPQINYRL